MRRIRLITVALAFLAAPPALAVAPPSIDPAALPPDETGPDQPVEQKRMCKAPLTLPGTNFHDPPWANTFMGVGQAHKFATGAGVTVALIDTGVDVSPRVPAEPGGDFVVTDGDGLTDCDAHGTLIASLIAGRPALTDGFVGVAAASNAPADQRPMLWFEVMKPMSSSATGRQGAHLRAFHTYATHAQEVLARQAHTAVDPAVQRAAVADWLYWWHLAGVLDAAPTDAS